MFKSYQKIFGIAILFLVVSYTTALEAPFKLSLSLDMIRHVIHSCDEQSLQIFEGMKLEPFKTQEDKTIQNMDVYVLPLEGASQAFNLDVDFSTAGLISVWTKNLQIKGTGRVHQGDVDKEGIAFEGKIDKISIVYNLNNYEKNKIGQESLKIKLQNFDVQVKDDDIKIASSGDSNALFSNAATKAALQKHIVSEIRRIAEERVKHLEDAEALVQEQRLQSLPFKLPARPGLPAIAFLTLSNYASKAYITDTQMIFEVSTLNFGYPTQDIQEKLKNIKHTWKEDKSNSNAFQLIIDQNIINAHFIKLSGFETRVSVRDLMTKLDKQGFYLPFLSTNYVGLLLPAISEEFGGGKDMDMELIASQEFINKQLPDVQPPGVQIEKDGTLKFAFNFVALLKVRKDDGWVIARSIYITFQVRAKLLLQSISAEEELVGLSLKGIEFSLFKMFKGDPELLPPPKPKAQKTEEEEDEDEEEEDDDEDQDSKMEGQLAQSLINVQLDAIRKTIATNVTTVLTKNLFTPAWMECFGLKLNVPQFELFQGGVRVVDTYQKVQPDQEKCKQFDETFSKEGKLSFPDFVNQPIDQIAHQIGLGEHATTIKSAFESGKEQFGSFVKEDF